MSTNHWIDILKQNNKLRTESELRNFDEALRNLAKQPVDARLLPDLFSIFDDTAEHLPLMWGLVHYIESFETKRQLVALIQATPMLLSRARTWSRILYTRVLNGDTTRNLLRTIFLSLPSEDQDFVRLALENVIAGEDAKNEMKRLKLRLEAKFVLS